MVHWDFLLQACFIYTGLHSQITSGRGPFTTMIIIRVNHYSFPVSQGPTRSDPDYFGGYLPLAGSGTTVWSKWNNMRCIKTHSYWTITAVCRYRDNDGSWFSPSCCHMNWPCSGTRQQRHPVDTEGKVRRRLQSGSNKGILQGERSGLVSRNTTNSAWLELLKPLSASQRCFRWSCPPFDLWFLRQHFLDLMNSPPCFLFHCVLLPLLHAATMRAVEMRQLKHAVVH